MGGEAWEALCETLRQASERVLGEGVPDSPRERAEGFRYLTRFLAAGIVSCVSHNDPDYPVFGRMIDYTMPWGLDNPDCLYLYAPLRGGAAYHVSGNRGSANHIDLQVNFGHYANGDITTWGTIASTDGIDLETDADGSFELWIGGEARPGNWLASRHDAEFMLVRQYFDDWEGERPADLLIERVGAEYPVPPPRSDEIARRLEKLQRWIDEGGALWEKMSRGFLAMPPNSLIVHMPEAAGERSGMRGQAYGMGHFRCAPDEAVIVEFSPPACVHWGIALANGYWECVEYASRQSSLNGFQATLDGDGIFRAVIAHRDPGVANWLDPGHNVDGTLTARFLHADRAPEVRFEVVPLADLRAALPADTPGVDADARAHALERRRRAVLRRFRE
jgi:hypothetical protein